VVVVNSGSLGAVRNEADAKLLSEKQHQIADLQNQLKTLVGNGPPFGGLPFWKATIPGF